MLFGSTTVELKDLLNHLSCLRVLYLDNVNLVELPDSICHLKHLRHLCLLDTSMPTIPRDIGDLKFLRALELAGCTNISQLPNGITKLRRLRLLNLRGTAITSVPRGFGKLEDLVAMCGFPTHSNDSTDGWCSLEELGVLSKLKALEIRGLEKAPSGSMAAKAMLSNKHHLIGLELMFTSRLGENGEVKDDISEAEHERTEEVLANLCPPTCIEELEITAYFARGLPQWMRTMSAFGKLRRLVLEDYACCTQLPNGLGQLTVLDYFWMKRAPSVQRIGHELLLPSLGDDGDGKDMTSGLTGAQDMMKQPHRISQGSVVAFPKLAKLGFQGMLRWTEWEWEQHAAAMPALKELTIWNCILQRLPPGLSYHALGLRELDLRNNTHLVSIENFPSLVKLLSYGNPRIERINNNPNLQWIEISECPALKELNSLPSLQSLEWWDWMLKHCHNTYETQS
jgi:Leucine-rich repeat (LRR) protein